MEDDQYQKRIVAFLDILGFSQWVGNADIPEWRSAIRSALNVMRNTLPTDNTFDLRVSQFSDCIVISAPMMTMGPGILRKGGGPFAYTFNMVMHGSLVLADNLLNRGVLLRGGIALGNMIHTDEVMFGPALLAAHSGDASGVPPRIAIHDSVYDEIDSWPNDFGLKRMIRLDAYDLTRSLHTLINYELYTPEPAVGKVVLDEPAKQIAKMIAEQCYLAGHTPPVRAKWLWLERYWNETVAAQGVLSMTTPFVEEIDAAAG